MCNRLGTLITLALLPILAFAAPPEDLLACRPQLHSLAALTMSFINPECRAPTLSKAEEESIKNAIIGRYGLNAPTWPQKEIANQRFQQELRAYEVARERQAAAQRASESAAADQRYAEEQRQKRLAQEQWRQKEIADAKADQEALQARLVDRTKRLRAGEISVTTYEDAKLFHNPVANLAALMAQPLLRPDGAMYAAVLLLDGEEKDGTLRAQAQTENGYAYAKLRIRPKSIQIGRERLRLNSRISIVGQYVDNFEYLTRGGQTKTGPVLDVAFIQP